MTTITDPIVTARLIGRRPVRTDFDRVDALLNHPDVDRTMGGPRTPDAVRSVLHGHLDGWARDGFGAWMLFDRATGDFVGRGGVKAGEVSGQQEIEVGYALLPRFWGAGLATEIALASVEMAFSKLGVSSVVGFTLVDNVASRRVLVKCGMTYERDIMRADLPHALFRRSRADPAPPVGAPVS